jgi:N-acetylglutamate synthase-like GNAT family acetyltransferase
LRNKETPRNIQIRRAVPDDASQIASLLHSSFVEYESSYTAEAFAATICTPEKIRERMGEGPVWIALKNGIIVGTVSAMPKGSALYIRGMAVDPSARGSGTGRALLNVAEEFATEGGFKSLLLSTTPFLSSAIGLYENYGFQRSNDGPHDLFETPLFTMVKSLRS